MKNVRHMCNKAVYDCLHKYDGHKGLAPIIGVSGGCDSTSLALIVWNLLKERKPRIFWTTKPTIVHFHHHLRTDGSADLDAQFVENLSKKLDFDFFRFDLDAAQILSSKQGIQSEAHNLRQKTLLKLVEHKYRPILLAHHKQDQVETILFRALSGRAIHSGIAEYNKPFLRPLLSLDKDDLRRYLLEQGQVWREDPSNQDASHYTRNKIRHLIMPVLKDVFPQCEKTLLKLILNKDEEI